MASLAETVKQNSTIKKDGGLYETSAEELGSLSGAVGRASNPVSPLGAKLLGANKDQVKMAGSSANKDAALNASASGDLSLRDNIRTTQASQDSTTAEEEAKKKEQALSGLKGSLDTRVQEIANQKLGGQTGFQVQSSVNPEKIKTLFPSLDAAGQTDMAASVTKLLSNPSDLESVKKVAAAMGMDTSTLSADQLISKVNGALASEKEALTSLGAGIDDQITMKDVFGTPEAIEALGDPAKMAEALGITSDEFENLNVPALKAKMAELGLESFSDVAELQRRLDDPYTSASERVALQKELRRLGASGVRGSEADYQKLQEEVNSSELVEIGGRQFTTEQLLTDATISGLIADYLEDPEAAKELAGTPFADFIERNRKVLTEASANLSGAAKAFADVNASNRALSKTASGSPIPDNVMKTLFPEFGQLGTAKIDPSKSPEYQNFISLPNSTQDAVIAALGGSQSPSIIKAVMGANPATLQSLAASGGLSSWVGFRQKYEEANKMPADAAVTTLLGQNPAQFAEALKEYKVAKDLGMLPQNYKPLMATLLDANNDGVLDSPEVLKAALLQHYSSAANNVPGDISGIPNPSGDLSKLNELPTQANSLYNQVRSYVKTDGAFDAADAKSFEKNATDQDLQSLLDSGIPNAGARDRILGTLTRRADAAIQDRLNADSAYRAFSTQVQNNNAQAKISSGLQVLDGLFSQMNSGSAANRAAVRSKITEITNQMYRSTGVEGLGIVLQKHILAGKSPQEAYRLMAKEMGA